MTARRPIKARKAARSGVGIGVCIGASVGSKDNALLDGSEPRRW
jgi:hypothetical protein